MTPEIAKIVARMTAFAVNTKDDAEFVVIARAADKLSKQDKLRSAKLTPEEEQIIKPFLSDKKVA